LYFEVGLALGADVALLGLAVGVPALSSVVDVADLAAEAHACGGVVAVAEGGHFGAGPRGEEVPTLADRAGGLAGRHHETISYESRLDAGVPLQEKSTLASDAGQFDDISCQTVVRECRTPALSIDEVALLAFHAIVALEI
jgi:hypothetical protein